MLIGGYKPKYVVGMVVPRSSSSFPPDRLTALAAIPDLTTSLSLLGHVSLRYIGDKVICLAGFAGFWCYPRKRVFWGQNDWKLHPTIILSSRENGRCTNQWASQYRSLLISPISSYNVDFKFLAKTDVCFVLLSLSVCLLVSDFFSHLTHFSCTDNQKN